MRRLLLGFLAPQAAAYVAQYMPLSSAELAKRFHVAAPPAHIQHLTSVTVNGARIEARDNGDLVIQGVDRQRKPWSFTGEWNVHGLDCFSADVDANGIPDLFCLQPTGGNGSAPTRIFIALLMDAAGRPVPAAFDGYFDSDAKGILDLLDLDGDGRAELVRQTFDDGYWITSLYQAENGRWRLVQGQHGARHYPLFTRYTHGPNRLAVVPPSSRHPREDDLSNILPSATALIERVALPSLRVGSVDCNLNGSLGGMIVIDSPAAGRRISTVGDPSDTARALLEEIRRAKHPVQIAGVRRRHKATGCAPETIWATSYE